jgi:hypothetical protein
MAKASDLVAVTSEDVALAWQDVESAKTEVEALRHRFVTGDDTVTQSEVASQVGVVEWLELVAHRAENQRERYEVAYAKQARLDLKDTILAGTAADGGELAQLLDSLYASAVEFVDKADAHSLQVRQWGNAAMALGVPDRGVISAAHEGLGIESGGTILVDEVRVPAVDAKSVLRLCFNAVENGILPNRTASDVAAARATVANMGKAAV